MTITQQNHFPRVSHETNRNAPAKKRENSEVGAQEGHLNCLSSDHDQRWAIFSTKHATEHARGVLFANALVRCENKVAVTDGQNSGLDRFRAPPPWHGKSRKTTRLLRIVRLLCPPLSSPASLINTSIFVLAPSSPPASVVDKNTLCNNHIILNVDNKNKKSVPKSKRREGLNLMFKPRPSLPSHR